MLEVLSEVIFIGFQLVGLKFNPTNQPTDGKRLDEAVENRLA
jgi:hypothetical protein